MVVGTDLTTSGNTAGTTAGTTSAGTTGTAGTTAGTAGTGWFWVGESSGEGAAGRSHTATAPLHEISPMPAPLLIPVIRNCKPKLSRNGIFDRFLELQIKRFLVHARQTCNICNKPTCSAF